MDIIENNPDKPWDSSSIFKNPNITMDIILENLSSPGVAHAIEISSNNMKGGKDIWIKKKVKATLMKRQVVYKILCNQLENDICELILDHIM